MSMLDRIIVDTGLVEETHAGERLELVVRSNARRRVRVTGDTVTAADQSTESSVLVRSIVDDAVGCATTNRTDRDTLSWAVRRARELRAAGQGRLRPALPRADPPAGTLDRHTELRDLLDLPLSASVDRLRGLTAGALSAPGAAQATAVWDHVASLVTLAATGAPPLRYAQPEVTLALNITLTDGHRTAGGTAGRSTVSPGLIGTEGLVDEAVSEATHQLPRRAAAPPAGPIAVVFAPRPWSRLLAQLAATFYTDRRDLSRSGLRAAGAEVMSPGVHLVDDPISSTELAFAPCDDEGTSARRTAVVRDGRLATLLSDRSSVADGEPCTGNGWMVPAGAGVGYGISVAGTCLAVEGPVVSLPSMLTTAPVLFQVTRVDDGNGRGVDAVNDIVRLTLSGWLVRAGEPAEPVAAATLGMPLKAFLLRIGAVSDRTLHYRVAAGSTLRKGPAVRSSHVLVDDLPIMFREKR